MSACICKYHHQAPRVEGKGKLRSLSAGCHHHYSKPRGGDGGGGAEGGTGAAAPNTGKSHGTGTFLQDLIYTR